MGEQRYSSIILHLNTRWRWVVSFTPRPLYLWGRSPWYFLIRRLDGPQCRFGRCGVEKNVFPLPVIKTLSSSPQPLPIPTELSGKVPWFTQTGCQTWEWAIWAHVQVVRFPLSHFTHRFSNNSISQKSQKKLLMLTSRLDCYLHLCTEGDSVQSQITLATLRVQSSRAVTCL
jgi:hypothetical protein